MKKTVCALLALLLLVLLAGCGKTQARAQALDPFVSAAKGVAANLAELDDEPELALSTAMTYFNSLLEPAALTPLRSCADDGEWGRFEYYLREAHGRYSEIYDRFRAGEPLREEDKAYLDTLRAALETLLGSLLKEDGRTYRREALKESCLSAQLAAFSANMANTAETKSPAAASPSRP